MNWRSVCASLGAILLTWSLIEMLYFGAIKPDGACAGSQLETASACYNTWGYTIGGSLLGLGLLLLGLLNQPQVGRGFQAVLATLFSIAAIPFILALVFFNVQTAQDTQYVMQFPEIQYRIVFILEGLSLIGVILFVLVYATFRYTRKTVQEVLQVEAPKKIVWAGEEFVQEEPQEST